MVPIDTACRVWVTVTSLQDDSLDANVVIVAIGLQGTWMQWSSKMLGSNSTLKVKRAHRDSSGEYLDIKSSFDRRGTTLMVSTNYISQSSGILKSASRILMKKVRTILITTNRARHYRGEALNYVAELYNHIQSSATTRQETPNEPLLAVLYQILWSSAYSPVYVHIWKGKMSPKLFRHTQLGAYSDTNNSHHRGILVSFKRDIF